MAKFSSNNILNRLPAREFDLIKDDLIAVNLPLRKSLGDAGEVIQAVYFIDSGFASIVDEIVPGREVEIGIIGHEGMSGLGVLFGQKRASHETYMQLRGTGHQLSAAKLRRAIDRSTALHRCLLQYAYAFLHQTAHTASSNAQSSLEERLARWLLMAHDRVDGDEVVLTHEFLSIMLGVRRAGITASLNLLSRKGLIDHRRSTVVIIDRGGLMKRANGAYGAPEIAIMAA